MKIFRLLCVAALAARAGEIPDMPAAYRADPDATIASAAKVTPERFPDADTVMIDDRLHTAYAPDGSDCTWDDEWVKVLTEKGRRAYATISISFSR